MEGTNNYIILNLDTSIIVDPFNPIPIFHKFVVVLKLSGLWREVSGISIHWTMFQCQG